MTQNRKMLNIKVVCFIEKNNFIFGSSQSEEIHATSRAKKTLFEKQMKICYWLTLAMAG